MAEEIQAENLTQAFMAIAVNASAHERRNVRVAASLRPQDVAALLVVIRIANRSPLGDRRWKVVEIKRVRKMEEAVEVMDVLERALLPALQSSFPVPDPMIDALDKCTDKLFSHAKEAGLEFSTKAEMLCGRLRDFLRVAGVLDDAAQLRVLADSLIRDVKAVLENVPLPERPSDDQNEVARLIDPLAKDAVAMFDDLPDAPSKGRPSRRPKEPKAGIGLRNLNQAFHDIVMVSNLHSRRKLTALKLCPRDVTALLTVLEIAKEGDKSWRIDNVERLRRMEQAVGVLTALESSVLPSIAEYPDNTSSILPVVGIYARDLLKHAMAVGGTFCNMAMDLCDALSNFVKSVDKLEVDETVEDDEQPQPEADDVVEEVMEPQRMADETEPLLEAGEIVKGVMEVPLEANAVDDEREQKLKALLVPIIDKVTRLLDADNVTVAQK